MIYNILIIGAGGIGKRHIKGYLGTRRAKISIVEPDVKKLNPDTMPDFDILCG